MYGLRFLFFSLLLASVLYAINRHAYSWLTRALRIEGNARRALIAVLVVAPLGVLFGRLLPGIQPDGALSRALIVAGTVELGLLFTVSLLLLWQGTLRLLRAGRSLRRAPATARAGAAAAPAAATTQAAAAARLTRRELVTQAAAGTAFALGGGAAGYGVLRGRHDYVLQDAPFRIPGLSSKLDGFSIVQLSDIHIGAFVGDAELAAVEEIVRGAKPDLIVLTGDLLDHDARLAERLAAFTRRLVTIPRGGRRDLG